jgi:hypothetical protein
MNDKEYLIAIVLAVISISISLIIAIDHNNDSTFQQKRIFAQTSSSSSSPSSAVHITKDTTNSYTISSGSSSVGTFDTTYTILGNVDSVRNVRDLIISTITKDYDSSPTIGYVKIAPQTTAEGETNASSSPPPPPPPPQSATLANPFADKTTINQKITAEIQKAMESAAKSNFDNVEIKCDFGMEISDWKCSSHGLLG